MVTKESLTKWALKNNWLKVGEGKTPEGYDQENFLAPSGQLVVAIYDSDDKLIRVGTMGPPPAPPPAEFRNVPPSDFMKNILNKPGWPPIR